MRTWFFEVYSSPSVLIVYIELRGDTHAITLMRSSKNDGARVPII